jgi:hypothetical protein
MQESRLLNTLRGAIRRCHSLINVEIKELQPICQQLKATINNVTSLRLLQ